VADAAASYARFRRALGDEPLPAALVDLDAFERNVDRLLAPIRAAGKRVRIASKSVRCPELLARIHARAGATSIGLMTYAARETAHLAAAGWRDLLLGYPTVHPADVRALAEANRIARAAVIVDDDAQLGPLAAAAAAAGVRIPVVIELDVAYRPVPGVVIGVRRSPLRTAEAAVGLARRVAGRPELELAGVMAYEAQIAGVTDAGPLHRLENPLRRALKRRSRPDVARTRSALVDALRAAGLPPALVNGGGTGSVDWAAAEPALTEITVGSGFVDGHLFDAYAGLALEPALYFALQIVRRPSADVVTCHGGGWIASGASGPDRLPRPALPAGCALLPLEGAGEVQTPVRLPRGLDLPLGAPIFFRPAKSGELAEHVAAYALVRGDRIEARAPTYRGLGEVFLG
jgi:D-serine deaminase-like pyridoxal phosphate-dependent protein